MTVTKAKFSREDFVASPERTAQLMAGARERKTKRFNTRNGAFVLGPIPWHWLVAVNAGTNRQTVMVGLAILLQTDRKKRTWVKLPRGLLRDAGVDHNARSRAVEFLERTGLIEAKRIKGLPTVVRLLPWKEPIREADNMDDDDDDD